MEPRWAKWNGEVRDLWGRRVVDAEGTNLGVVVGHVSAENATDLLTWQRRWFRRGRGRRIPVTDMELSGDGVIRVGKRTEMMGLAIDVAFRGRRCQGDVA